MDLEKIAAVMEQFERSFDSLDLASATVEGAMGSATAGSMPEEEVDALINQVSAAPRRAYSISPHLAPLTAALAPWCIRTLFHLPPIAPLTLSSYSPPTNPKL
jgi:hypothetical protein